ncbi:MAG: DNA-binding response regulator [Nitrospirae bacterium]|nr:MAG: DNA-binding response regulator [Nitrospirota bacterium]
MNGMSGLSFNMFCSVFKVVVMEFCPCLQHRLYQEYLTQLVEPAVRDLYAFGIGRDYLGAVFHAWEKSLYPIIAGLMHSDTEAIHEILLVDHVFHCLLIHSLALYTRLESERLPFQPLVFLTPRQKEILSRLSAGQQNKEIARALGLSRRTIEGHRLRLMQKVGATSVADLIRYGMRSGFLAEESLE